MLKQMLRCQRIAGSPAGLALEPVAVPLLARLSSRVARPTGGALRSTHATDELQPQRRGIACSAASSEDQVRGPRSSWIGFACSAAAR